MEEKKTMIKIREPWNISALLPDDGANVGVKLGHQNSSADNEDVQNKHMEETKHEKTHRMYIVIIT